ncbi:MAG TPA: hypothetical protein ENG74_02920 [Thermoplasmatales archaeon]|nr:hypothetical protein [Thermoplasmatales archaeon]
MTGMVLDVDKVGGFSGEGIKYIYRDPPPDLNKMVKLIEEGINLLEGTGETIDLVVIDSISQFVDFSFPRDTETRDFYNFVRSLKNNVMDALHDTVILLYDNKSRSMRVLPVIHTDLVLNMEIIREKMTWVG